MTKPIELSLKICVPSIATPQSTNKAIPCVTDTYKIISGFIFYPSTILWIRIVNGRTTDSSSQELVRT